MKEKFRDKVPSGKIRVKYWLDKSIGKFDYWHTTAEELTDEIVKIINYYESIEIKLTNRQLYYQLVGKDLIPNAQEVYKRICTFITDLRYCGLVDWESIEDKSRVPKRHAEWDNVSDLVDSAIYAFRLPRTSDQEYYIEMYCEKEAGVNVLSTVADEFHVYFGFNKGYSSAAAMYQLAKRVKNQIEEGKEVIILYFGDHDPSGLDMIRDIEDRVTEFLENGDYFTQPNFNVIPVALNMDQIRKYNPPPNPAKITDPRAKWYIEKYGKKSWELDAIDALELREIAKNSVLKYTEMEKYEVWKNKEQKAIKSLENFAKTLDDE